jgi:hypothetical protein
LIDNNNLAQNSWKAHWLIGSTFDPTIDGTYDFSLTAFSGTTEMASTNIQIIVGQGAAPVPEPATMLLFGLGLLGLAGVNRRKK